MQIQTNYLEEIKKRKVETKARDLREEIVWKYIEQLNWTNEKFFQDYNFFWSATRTFWTRHTPAELEKIMQWAASKKVHPRGVANLLKKA